MTLGLLPLGEKVAPQGRMRGELMAVARLWGHRRGGFYIRPWRFARLRAAMTAFARISYLR